MVEGIRRRVGDVNQSIRCAFDERCDPMPLWRLGIAAPAKIVRDVCAAGTLDKLDEMPQLTSVHTYPIAECAA